MTALGWCAEALAANISKWGRGFHSNPVCFVAVNVLVASPADHFDPAGRIRSEIINVSDAPCITIEFCPFTRFVASGVGEGPLYRIPSGSKPIYYHYLGIIMKLRFLVALPEHDPLSRSKLAIAITRPHSCNPSRRIFNTSPASSNPLSSLPTPTPMSFDPTTPPG